MVNTWISDIRARQKASRNTVILGLSRKRILEIIGNTNFGNIDTLISQGHDMEFIAGHWD